MLCWKRMGGSCGQLLPKWWRSHLFMARVLCFQRLVCFIATVAESLCGDRSRHFSLDRRVCFSIAKQAWCGCVFSPVKRCGLLQNMVGPFCDPVSLLVAEDSRMPWNRLHCDVGQVIPCVDVSDIERTPAKAGASVGSNNFERMAWCGHCRQMCSYCLHQLYY